MLVERFVSWSRTACVRDRGEAVRKLCEAYRFATVPENERRTTVAVLTAALDDPSPKVRRVLAEGLAPCEAAPRHILLSLLRDVPSVAERVLDAVALSDADLSTFVAGDEACALAMARRSSLSAGLARSIVMNGGRDAVLVLLANPTLVLSDAVLGFIADRHGEDRAIRYELLSRALPAELRLRLRRSLALDLADHIASKGWLSRSRVERIALRDGDDAILDHAADLGLHETREFVGEMMSDGRFTTALLLRAAVSGRLHVVEAACAHLTGAPLSRVGSAFRSRRHGALKALLLKGGIGARLGEILWIAHSCWTEAARYRDADGQTGRTRVLRAVVREVSVLPNLDAQTACLLAEIEVGIERDAAHAHADQLLLAA